MTDNNTKNIADLLRASLDISNETSSKIADFVFNLYLEIGGKKSSAEILLEIAKKFRNNELALAIYLLGYVTGYDQHDEIKAAFNSRLDALH